MDYKPLYLAYTDNGYPKEHKDHENSECGLIYFPESINNIKVVACPFCGVSTSNGEKMLDCRVQVRFECLSCNAVAFSTPTTKIVTREEVENAHPHNSITDANAVFHLVKLSMIFWVSNELLLSFSTSENITNDEVVAFYNNIEDFKRENSIDVELDNESANKFLRHNELAKKYDIKFGAGVKGLSLDVDCYNLADVNFCLPMDLALFAANTMSYVIELNPR